MAAMVVRATSRNDLVFIAALTISCTIGMKQVEKTPDITTKLQNAVGAGVDTSNLAVFEAVALNSLPIRKRHPIYKDAVHPQNFLHEMASSLNGESLPLHLVHNDTVLPVGRAFYGEVVSNFGISELHTLFFVDKQANPDLVSTLDNGTVDQVSVSVLPKAVVCAECGFDFLGEDADLWDHILTGTDPKGHTMGKDGAHAIISGLEVFNEISLVGKGGARNARILNRDDQKLAGSTTYKRLAASGIEPSVVTLVATSEPLNMDLSQLVAELTDAKAKITVADAKVTDLTTQLTAATAKVTDLEAKVAAAPKQEDLDAALNALRDVTKKVLVASGKVDADTTKFDVATCVSTITDTSTKLAAKLVAGGHAKEATADAAQVSSASSGAFRTRS